MSALVGMSLLWVLGLMGVAVVLTFYRLRIGPTVADRVIALDLLSTIGIGIIVVYSIETDKKILLDAAILLALISFVATVAFARYLEKGVRR